jgi:hypothetical protein
MQFAFHPLLIAQTADRPGQAVYEVSRLREFDDARLPAALIALVAAAVFGAVWYLYRRDTVELPRPVGIFLAALRLLAFGGLIVYFLGIERRTTREIVHRSQVVVLVDVSQSMGLPAGGFASDTGKSRLQEVTSALSESPLIAELRKTHDVTIMRFDRELDPLATFGQESRVEGQAPDNQPLFESGELAASQLAEALQPRGTETRLGQALEQVLARFRDAPLAGVIVFSDGAQNAGIEPSSVTAAALEARVPLYAVGVGSPEPQRNVAVSDLVVPTRAFPGDTLNITAYLQATGFAGRDVTIELHRRGANQGPPEGRPLATEHVTIGADDQIRAIEFTIDPGPAGTYVYLLRVAAPPEDLNPRDNQREAEVEVIDRQTRVLLFASGPMRDYQYLRNQLHRDESMTVDVLLQSARPGVSQDASRILNEFPDRREALYSYDAIVAFDPDWSQLDAAQVELLESWVAGEAGGLILIAGPIHTSRLPRSAEQAKIRDLYPVLFQQRLTLMDDGQYGGTTPWPLEFERAGREARFLWLGSTADESAVAWSRFPGVYGYYEVRGEKPGATVYARFSDPQAAGLAGDGPVYMAGQFYGAGQVFYIGSGELWRLRTADPKYFEVLYTKLIRHVSQGRMLRGSSRGALLVERDRYELGENVVIRARLADEQHNPLKAASVTAQAMRPDGTTEPVKLSADADRPGMYVGQLSVMQEGTYQLALPLEGEEEPLSRFLQVRVPDLERRNAQRNEALLAALSRDTGGIYYAQIASATDGDDSLRPLPEVIPNRAEVKTMRGAPDKEFTERQMHWLLAVVAGALFVEWIVRRLSRLA